VTVPATAAVKRVLVLNPNTAVTVTDAVVRECRRTQPSMQWEGRTARFGGAYIADEATYAVAAHAVLDAFDALHDGHDAVHVACFADPGLLALRERARVPVLGPAQASFEAAARRGRFAVVTGGRAWGPMLERFARAQRLDSQLVGIQSVGLTGAQIAVDPDRALDVAQADLLALHRHDVLRSGTRATEVIGPVLQAEARRVFESTSGGLHR
jgi:Asp/Glu/hydantoin racemase